MTTSTLTVTDFVLARLAEDEATAKMCAEMFPPPWEVADRGWRVRIYASNVEVEDLASDDDGTPAMRAPIVMEVEPDRILDDPRWLSERVEHVLRHDPARVLAQCAAMRRIVERHSVCDDVSFGDASTCPDLRDLAAIWSDDPQFREEWRP